MANPGIEDLSPHAGVAGLRLGTRATGNYPAQEIRKMLVYKSIAIHTSSANTITDLL